ncbi:MAG: DUF2071 domain-containing protein [Phycisphaeraceae bacterium]
MRLPVIRGLIDRRILANFRVAPAALVCLLPAPFRPKLVQGFGVAGVCLIRLTKVRPRGFPAWMGMRSENAAHRIAVEWDEGGTRKEGVYVPRRDTSSRFNACFGGRLFPGVQHHAAFDVKETEKDFHIALRSDDGQVRITVDATVAEALPEGSVFSSVEEVSSFFERGSLGYSATREAARFDGMELKSFNWKVTPLHVQRIESSFFSDEGKFPPGSAVFDNALLMRQIEHEWHSRPTPTCDCVTATSA